MDISVLIPVVARPELARACLDSLARTVSRRWRYEVVCIGNSNVPDYLSAGLHRGPRPRLLRRDGLSTRAALLNAAARAATAPVLCLLDPGTTLVPGWLEPLWRLLRRERMAGCVGNVQREPYSGLIDNAGFLFSADGLPSPARHGEPLVPRLPSVRRPAVPATCCLVTRATFGKLGGFDERFRHRFDDVDFCLRAAGAGYRHFVSYRSVVYHLAAPAPGQRPGEPDDADLTLYRSRWGERIRLHAAADASRHGVNTFSPERWRAATETRRQQRQDFLDARMDGLRYLKKHLFKPWRYNYQRVCHALARSTHPLPVAIPPPPVYVADNDLAEAFDPAMHGRDAPLFGSPRR